MKQLKSYQGLSQHLNTVHADETKPPIVDVYATKQSSVPETVGGAIFLPPPARPVGNNKAHTEMQDRRLSKSKVESSDEMSASDGMAGNWSVSSCVAESNTSGTTTSNHDAATKPMDREEYISDGESNNIPKGDEASAMTGHGAPISPNDLHEADSMCSEDVPYFLQQFDNMFYAGEGSSVSSNEVGSACTDEENKVVLDKISNDPKSIPAQDQEYANPEQSYVPSSAHSNDKTVWFSDNPIIQDPEQPNPFTKPYIRTSAEYMRVLQPCDMLMLRLHNICERANTPPYLPDLIVEVFRKAVIDDKMDLATCHIPRYKSFLSRMSKMFPTVDPEVVPVTLESEIEIKDTRAVDTQQEMRRIVLTEGTGERSQGHRKKLSQANVSNEVLDQGYETTHVVRFSFLSQVEDLLADQEFFSDMSNFEGVINPLDRFGKFGQSGDDALDELVTGDWYDRTYLHAQSIVSSSMHPKDPFMVIPIILYTDKTGLDAYNRIAMEPVLLMLGILNRRARNKDRGKRLLGYIPDLDLKSTAEKERSRQTEHGKGRSIRNYHKCMSVITDDIADSQGYSRRVVGFVRIGDQVMLARLFFPLAFVIGDGKSSDTIVGRYVTAFCNFRSRLCCCEAEELDNPFHKCSFVDEKSLQAKANSAHELSMKPRLSDSQELRLEELRQKREEDDADSLTPGEKTELIGLTGGRFINEEQKSLLDKLREELRLASRHIMKNAFDNVNIGVHTIVGAGVSLITPVDPMHMFLHGLLKNTLKIIVANLTPLERQKVDRLVNHTFARYRSSESKNFPRTNFVRGITNLTLITADEWVGVALTLLLVLHNREGWDLFKKSLRRRENDLKRKHADLPNKLSELKKKKEEFNSIAEKIKDNSSGRDHRKKLTSRKFILKVEIRKLTADIKAVVGAIVPDDDNENLNGKMEDCDDQDFADEEAREIAPPHVCKNEDIMELLEAMLCFHSWYKNPPHLGWRKLNMVHNAEWSVRLLLNFVRKHTPRLQGLGWQISKFHDHLHLVYPFMHLFGSSLNFDASNGEHSLIRFAKKTYSLVQKHSQAKVMEQSAKLISQYGSLQKARMAANIPDGYRCCRDVISGDGRSEVVQDSSKQDVPDDQAELKIASELDGHPKYRIRYGTGESDVDNSPEVTWLSRRKLNGPREVHPVIVAWFRHQASLFFRKKSSVVDCYTEYRRDGTIFRAHPNYRSSGPWYDWVMINFTPTDDHDAETSTETFGYYGDFMYPSKILCFFKNPDDDTKIMALVHSTNSMKTTTVNKTKGSMQGPYEGAPGEHDEGNYLNESSCICEIWAQDYRKEFVPSVGEYMLHPNIYCVDVETFDRRVYVVEEAPGIREGLLARRFDHGIPRVTLVLPVRNWGEEFTSHIDDLRKEEERKRMFNNLRARERRKKSLDDKTRREKENDRKKPAKRKRQESKNPSVACRGRTNSSHSKLATGVSTRSIARTNVGVKSMRTRRTSRPENI